MNTNLLVAALLIPAFATAGVCAHKKEVQAEATKTASMDLANATMANEKLSRFKALVAKKGIDEVVQEMKGDSNSPHLNNNDQSSVQSLALGQNPVQIIKDGKLKVSADPSKRDSDITQEPWFLEIKSALQASDDGQVVITHPCKVTNPADKDGAMIDAKRTFVAWGNKAFGITPQEQKVIAFIEVTA